MATWRDGFLKASAPVALPDCQRLLDALYSDELLGAPARAVVGLDDGYADAQLRYQVSAQRPADVDRALAWLRTLPQKCRQFTATTARGAVQTVQVADSRLPEFGDARQGLRVTLTREEAGQPVTLTVDAAAVRVGQDAFTVTNGGLADVYTEVTQAVAELGGPSGWRRCASRGGRRCEPPGGCHAPARAPRSPRGVLRGCRARSARGAPPRRAPRRARSGRARRRARAAAPAPRPRRRPAGP
ncbi:hypothetical protein GCM10020295_40310 [Streptomyces cinereospinus]